MKAKILIAVILGLFLTGSAFAQVTVYVGTPPLWGPVGYSNVQYYYLPDVESYYDVHNARFIYYERGTWVHRKYLPRQYRSYNLYNGYKVVMTDYRGNSPYAHFKDHKYKYAKGYKGPEQKTIGMRPDHRKQAVRNANRSHSSQKAAKMSHSKKQGKGKSAPGGRGKKK
jgi:hypothetical protein